MQAIEPKEPAEVELASGTLQVGTRCQAAVALWCHLQSSTVYNCCLQDAVKQLKASAATLQLRRETQEANLAPKRPGKRLIAGGKLLSHSSLHGLLDSIRVIADPGFKLGLLR